jgi:ribosomal protein S11
LLPSIHHHFTNKKGEVISGLQLVKWVLEVLKKYPYAAQMAAEDCKVAL